MIRLQEKKILVIIAACVSAMTIFWAFISLPAGRKLHLLNTELYSIKQEIAAIESRAGRNIKDIAELVDPIQNAFKGIIKKFPEGEEDALKLLSAEANKRNIEMAYMRPAQKAAYMNQQGNPLFIDGKQCFCLPISMEMTGLYKDAGEYLRWLRKEFPPLIKVSDIVIKRDESRMPQLKVNMAAAIYILRDTQG
jgi:Tfp pilus assembly protein PilO